MNFKFSVKVLTVLAFSQMTLFCADKDGPVVTPRTCVHAFNFVEPNRMHIPHSTRVTRSKSFNDEFYPQPAPFIGDRIKRVNSSPHLGVTPVPVNLSAVTPSELDAVRPSPKKFKPTSPIVEELLSEPPATIISQYVPQSPTAVSVSSSSRIAAVFTFDTAAAESPSPLLITIQEEPPSPTTNVLRRLGEEIKSRDHPSVVYGRFSLSEQEIIDQFWEFIHAITANKRGWKMVRNGDIG